MKLLEFSKDFERSRNRVLVVASVAILSSRYPINSLSVLGTSFTGMGGSEFSFLMTLVTATVMFLHSLRMYEEIGVVRGYGVGFRDDVETVKAAAERLKNSTLHIQRFLDGELIGEVHEGFIRLRDAIEYFPDVPENILDFNRDRRLEYLQSVRHFQETLARCDISIQALDRQFNNIRSLNGGLRSSMPWLVSSAYVRSGIPYLRLQIDFWSPMIFCLLAFLAFLGPDDAIRILEVNR